MALPVLSPDPGVGLARVYNGLPEHYQTADEAQGFPLYRWLAGVCRVLSDLEEIRSRVDYIAPGDRFEPWAPGVAATQLVVDPLAQRGDLAAPAAWSYGFTNPSMVEGRMRVTVQAAAGGTPYVLGYTTNIPADATRFYATVEAGRTGAVGTTLVSEVRWQDGLGNQVSVDAFPQIASNVGLVRQTIGPLTPPAGATRAVVISYTAGSWAAGNYIELEAWSLQTTDAEPFDGYTPSTNKFTYGWTELPYASSSFRTPRPDDTSDLGDPTTANLEWLAWLAQLVGVDLDPAFTPARARDAVRYASAGWRAGTKAAVADAAKSELTGTKHVDVYDHAISNIGNGGVWDVLIVTRPTETPNVAAVLAAVIERGAKPAGVVLRHRAFESSWDTVTAVNPTWADIDPDGWDNIQEAGF